MANIGAGGSSGHIWRWTTLWQHELGQWMEISSGSFCILSERNHPAAGPCAFMTTHDGVAVVDDCAAYFGEVNGTPGIAQAHDGEEGMQGKTGNDVGGAGIEW